MYIIYDDMSVPGFHRNIPFYIAAKTFQYGFQKMGIAATIIQNTNPKLRQLIENDTVLVFPHHFDLLNGIPCKIIFYNSESLVLYDKIVKWTKDPRVIMVWDYAYNNIDYLKKFNTNVDHFFVPPSYSPTFIIEPKSIKKDIDVLFYGAFKRRRLAIKRQFEKNKGMVSRWGETFVNHKMKYDSIRRAKIVIIIHSYKEDLPIDYFRMGELISNKFFFIHEMPQESERCLYDKYKNYVVFAKYEDLLETCVKYLKETQEERDRLAERAFEFYSTEEKIESYMECIKSRIL